MRKLLFYVGLLPLIAHSAMNGQHPFYDLASFGTYGIGYTDTIIYDPGYTYDQYGYLGPKPFFVQIWHPVVPTDSDEKLVVGSFSEKTIPENLRSVFEQLQKHVKEMTIRDAIAENLLTGEDNDFGELSYEDVFELFNDIPTRSVIKNNLELKDAPVIVYHHGAQGSSAENYLMAEYFASKGFIVIAANYHLPYANMVYGLKPFDKLVQGEDEEALRHVIAFASKYTDGGKVFFAGHSWGAQMGWRALDTDTTIAGFVSLETTIEYKSDSATIKSYWPEMFDKIAVQNPLYPFPIMLCAGTGNEEIYPFFKAVNAEALQFVSTVSDFDHNGYTTLYYMRLFVKPELNTPDRAVLANHLGLYVKHLEIVHGFFAGILSGSRHYEGGSKRLLFLD